MNTNEQLLIAGLGFVIGFTSAFLIFGVPDAPKGEYLTGHVAQDPYGLVANASDAAGVIEDVVISNDGLFAKLGGKERIVSASAIGPEERIAGYHYAVAQTLVSPDSQYLYYCALAAPVDTSCYHYIYSAIDDSIYPVKDTNTNEYLRTQAESLEVMWQQDGTLMVNELVSISANEPWLVK